MFCYDEKTPLGVWVRISGIENAGERTPGWQREDGRLRSITPTHLDLGEGFSIFLAAARSSEKNRGRT